LRSTGYGQININGKILKAHRVAWELLNGPIPNGLNVLHHCDNPVCVNAESHLYLGTQKENINDWKERNIGAEERRIKALPRGDNHYSKLKPESLSRGDNHFAKIRPHLLSRGDNHYLRKDSTVVQGSNNGNAKLNEKLAMEIFNSKGTHKEIAENYNVNKTTVRMIKIKATWKHIHDIKASREQNAKES
jgi:hypothetical protein